MKAIILVAGAGTKLRPHTYTQPKALIPLAGKTILSFIIDQLAEGGIREFIFVTGYLGEKIQDFVQKRYSHLNCHFVKQIERKGTGQAVWLTKSLVNLEEVFIVLGDTICEFDLRKILQSQNSMLGIKKVDDPRNFGVAVLGSGDRISQLMEKPQIPKSNMALVGLYKIRETQELFSCLERNIQQGAQSSDEIHLTDALECMIQSGISLRSFRVDNWFDCGRKDKLLESNATLLKKLGSHQSPILPYENSIIITPVSIAEGCNIKNSIIGPNVAIGENTVINYSIIKNSIIGSFSNLLEVVLNSSLIGSDANIRGLTQSLNIGDNTEIDFQ